MVPPSVGPLFVGAAHHVADGEKSEPAEVITLSLTFDHRVVNGAGAANFVHEIKEQIEGHRKLAALNPNRRGPKTKRKPACPALDA